MILVSNSFNGGTSSVDITSANSGEPSGTAFSSVATSLATLKYSTIVRTDGGTLSAAHVSSADNGVSLYKYTGLIATADTLYVRLYIYVTTFPPSGRITLLFFQGSTGQGGMIALESTGQIKVYDKTGTLFNTSSMALSSASWYRLEVKHLQHASAGTLDCHIYSSYEGTTIAETVSGTAMNNHSGVINELHIGSVVYFGVGSTYNFNTDDVAVGTNEWIGPVNLLNAPLSKNKFFNPQAVYRM